MSERGQQLYNAFKGIAKPQVQIFPAIVKEVTGSTVSVEVDGLIYEGVQLQATEKEGVKGVLITPEVGSVVLVQRILNSDDFLVAMYSEVAEIIHQTSKAKILINDNGIGIYADGESMLDILVDFIDACINERHLTKSGPTVSISTESQTRFVNIKNRVKKLLQNA